MVRVDQKRHRTLLVLSFRRPFLSSFTRQVHSSFLFPAPANEAGSNLGSALSLHRQVWIRGMPAKRAWTAHRMPWQEAYASTHSLNIYQVPTVCSTLLEMVMER
jgi:hypothetical protein